MFCFYNFSVVSGVYEDAESITITYNTVITLLSLITLWLQTSILGSHSNQSVLEPILGQILHLAVPKVNRILQFCLFGGPEDAESTSITYTVIANL